MQTTALLDGIRQRLRARRSEDSDGESVGWETFIANVDYYEAVGATLRITVTKPVPVPGLLELHFPIVRWTEVIEVVLDDVTFLPEQHFEAMSGQVEAALVSIPPAEGRPPFDIRGIRGNSPEIRSAHHRNWDLEGFEVVSDA